MQTLSVQKIKSMDSQPIEIVERKGIGHPDTIADGIAEAVSIDYSNFCLKNFGAVLHHHFDKTLVMGGRAKIDYGIGKMQKPVRLIINGRASEQFANKKIDYKKIQVNAAKQYLKKVLPNLDVNEFLKIYSFTTSYSRQPIWYHPRDLDDLPELKKPYMNDTSAIVGFWPLSSTERLVLKLEKFFYDKNNKPKFNFVGQDIKVFANRIKNNIKVTLCVPFLSKHIADTSEYFNKLNKIYKQLLDLAHRSVGNNFKIEIFINTSDNNLLEGPKIGTSRYFVVSGSALDYGEEGLVGRGNRARGVISCMRPSSTDAFCGKNPSFHVGKVYSYFSNKIAEAISKEFKCECTVILSTQNKRVLTQPQKIIVQTTKKCRQDKISQIVEKELAKKDWIEKIVKDKYFLPLPGGSYGYQV
jgi:S-adenosylmethionine synthetase